MALFVPLESVETLPLLSMSSRPPSRAEKSSAASVAAFMVPLLVILTSMSPPAALVSAMIKAASVSASIVPLLMTAKSTFSVAELLPISSRSILPALSTNEDTLLMSLARKVPMMEPAFKSAVTSSEPVKSMLLTLPVLMKAMPLVILVASMDAPDAALLRLMLDAPLKSISAKAPDWSVMLPSVAPAKPNVPSVAET